MLEPLLTGREAFVLGSRHGGKTWKIRHFEGNPISTLLFNVGHWFFCSLVNILYGLRLNDPFTMYEVQLTFQRTIKLKMLVDSGADFSLIPKELGSQLGYVRSPGETINQAEGVEGSVGYLLRDISMAIDSHSVTVPVAWLQTETCEEILLSRENEST